MADQPHESAGPTTSALPQLPSCAVCRQRKIKCDRQQPCSNCVRSGCECVFPSGRGRAPKRSRRVVEGRLIDKLARLETIVQHLAAGQTSSSRAPSPNPEVVTGTEQKFQINHIDPPPASNAQRSASPPERKSSNSTLSSLESQLSRLVMDDKKSYYVSHPLWASMSHEIDELREILTGPEDDEDDNDMMWSDTASNQSNTNAALFGYRALAHSLRQYHPQLSQAVNLFALFNENVAPLTPMFHIPTLSRTYWDAIASLDTLDKNVEALVFAIYYAAIVSMSSEECIALLGITRDTAIERYRFAVEQAIARADLLNTQSMTLLQAVVLFLVALRTYHNSRTVWSLAILVFNIARAMGLHRDGTAFGLKPFQTELRRRLWWHICVLENRASDNQGFRPVSSDQSSFDTRIPLNINDKDLSPDATEPPAERDEGTQMTFFLIRCETLRIVSKIHMHSADAPNMARQADGKTGRHLASVRTATVRELEETLRGRYMRHCEGSPSPILAQASFLARLILLHFRLVLYYPLMRLKSENPSRRAESHPESATDNSTTSTMSTGETAESDQNKPAAGGSPTRSDLDVLTRDQLFHTSIEVLELTTHALDSPDVRKFKWHWISHAQWHVVAFVLSEICRRPASPDCEKAWNVAMTVCSIWGILGGEKGGTMWKSVQRLMAKARYMRDMQALAGTRKPEKQAHSAPPRARTPGRDGAGLLKTESPASWGTPDSATSWAGEEFTTQFGFRPGLLGMELDDPLMDLLSMPMDLDMGDVFNTTDTTQGGLPSQVRGDASGVGHGD